MLLILRSSGTEKFEKELQDICELTEPQYQCLPFLFLMVETPLVQKEKESHVLHQQEL
jgi:hypothetical protein